MRATIRPAEAADIDVIAGDIRPADAVEMEALGTDPAAAMREGMARSDWTMTGLLDGVPVCMFGVAAQNVVLGHGVPWMLSANAIERAQLKFLRACRPVVARMRESYPSLRNVVHAENHTAIRWLRWLGFRFLSEDAQGSRHLVIPINGNDFYLFSMGDSDV